jgi:hypothetical protein
VQGQHAGRAQDHVVVPQLRLDQRHARQLALREEMALGVHHHPGAVELQPGLGQQHILHLHAGAGFHRIHIEARDHRAQVEGCTGRCVVQ